MKCDWCGGSMDYATMFTDFDGETFWYYCGESCLDEHGRFENE